MEIRSFREQRETLVSFGEDRDPDFRKRDPQLHLCSYPCRQEIKIRNPKRKSTVCLCYDTHIGRGALRAPRLVCDVARPNVGPSRKTLDLNLSLAQAAA